MTNNAVDILTLLDFPPVTDQRLREHFTVHDLHKAADPEAFLAEMAPKIRGIATMGHLPCREDLIARLPELEIISCFAVGVDGVDVAAASKRDVIVTNTPAVLNDCVADLAMGLTIATLRQIPQADRFVRTQEWLGPSGPGSYPLTRSLKGKTMGILGLGRIGLETATRAQAFGMKIAYHNRNRRDDVDFDYYDTPEKLARAADVVVVLCPGGAATRHVVNKAVLDALGPDSFLVSISRGSCVDEAALVDALVNRRIAGAAMDVYENEPAVPEVLKTLDNVVLAPHMGSATIETRKAMGDLMIDNLIAHFAGKPVLTRFN